LRNGVPRQVIVDYAKECRADLIVVGSHGKTGLDVEILRVAADTAADLIVMGVHGRNVVDMTLFGSTTNQLVRRAACPVLTYRPQGVTGW